MTNPRPLNDASRLEKQAASAYQGKHYQVAAELYERIAEAYAQSGDILSAAEARNNASVAYLQIGNAPQALRLVEGTVQCFAQAGDTRRQGMAMGNLAAALEALGRAREAEQAYRQAAQLLGEAGEAVMKAYTLQALSALQLRHGKQFEALVTMRSSLEEHPNPTPKMKWVKRLIQLPFNLFRKGS